jgi:hypothetical protein
MLKAILKWLTTGWKVKWGSVKSPYGNEVYGVKFTKEEKLPPEGSPDRD